MMETEPILWVLGVLFSFNGLQDQSDKYTKKDSSSQRAVFNNVIGMRREKYKTNATWPVMMNGV